MPCEVAAGKKAQRGHQHRHHDGAEPQHGAFHGRVKDRLAAGAELVDVLHHDDAYLHRDAEQRQESNPGGNAKIGAA